MIRLFENASHTEAYALFRPKSPKQVADITMQFMKKRMQPCDSGLYCTMVDVGCGSGQSTELFASYFKNVIGIDPSKNQIDLAKKNNKYSHIDYQQGSGESMDIVESTVDLVASGQAVHWMNFQEFFGECHRILKPNGCLLLHGYDLPKIYPFNETSCGELSLNADKLLYDFYQKCIFHPSRSHVDDHYSRIFNVLQSDNKIKNESVKIQNVYKLSDFFSYLRTWSGYRTYVENNDSFNIKSESTGSVLKHDILNEFITNLEQKWGINHENVCEVSVTVVWDVFMILSEIPRLWN